MRRSFLPPHLVHLDRALPCRRLLRRRRVLTHRASSGVEPQVAAHVAVHADGAAQQQRRRVDRATARHHNRRVHEQLQRRLRRRRAVRAACGAREQARHLAAPQACRVLCMQWWRVRAAMQASTECTHPRLLASALHMDQGHACRRKCATSSLCSHLVWRGQHRLAFHSSQDVRPGTHRIHQPRHVAALLVAAAAAEVAERVAAGRRAVARQLLPMQAQRVQPLQQPRIGSTHHRARAHAQAAADGVQRGVKHARARCAVCQPMRRCRPLGAHMRRRAKAGSPIDLGAFCCQQQQVQCVRGGSSSMLRWSRGMQPAALMPTLAHGEAAPRPLQLPPHRRRASSLPAA